MEWIIDGYNLLISYEFGHDSQAREDLGRQLRALFQGKDVKVTTVYDSAWSDGSRHRKIADNVFETYARGSADDCIVRLVRTNRYPRAVTVVTDDREIKTRIREYGARSLGCRDFLKLLRPAPPERAVPEKPETDSAAEIERLLRLWGG
ncbi:MAG TPA: NYN domain-containing protein [bacterium]|nr:NYN domain-containing protein [bacterium]HPQ66430.1 NYN domain-containing protein [bacterium]